MDINIAQLLQTYFQDAEEHLEQIDGALLQLASEPDSQEAVGSLFRSVHSLKGDSGALGFDDLERLLHRFETYLDLLRNQQASLDSHSLDIFSSVVDCIELLVRAARDEKPTPDGLAEAMSLVDELLAEHRSESRQQLEDVTDQDFELFESGNAGQPVEISERYASHTPDPASEETPQAAHHPGVQELPFFGDFLVHRGLLTIDQVKAALHRQRSQQPLIGSLLLKANKLTLKQVEAILQYQQSYGMRFGEAAIQLGYLEEGSLLEALAEQRRARPGLRMTLVELGFIDRATVQKAFLDFQQAFPEARPDSSTAPTISKAFDAPTEPPGQSPTTVEFHCDAELLAEFIVDSDEHLAIAEEQLLVIESDPGNTDALNAIYRSFHTIKGLSSFLGLEDARNLAHQAESMLNMARDSQLLLSGDAFEVALSSVDGLKRQIRFAREWLRSGGGLEVDQQLNTILSAIDEVVSGKSTRESVSLDGGFQEANQEISPADSCAVGVSSQSSLVPAAMQIKETIKVDRERLDKLINVIGELVIGQAIVEQEAAQWQAQAGHESPALAQLNKTVRDLQELSLSLRMVPVGSAFQKMARIVRDLGRKLGKDIAFHTEGDDTELDKSMVDQIADPLLHMVRNAADHGIEYKEDRLAAGKPAHGTISLRAYHQSGNIYLEIGDDGKGLDSEVLLKKAIEKGIVREGESLSEQEIQNLIFAPGFSTAKQVTDVSGRGVGMDVVRRNVEALQGSVSVTSRKGVGSTVVIRLPLTLAILDGLSIRLADQVFIIPILSVLESFSPNREDIRKIGGKGEVVMVRGEVLPLLRLDRLLGNAGLGRSEEAEALVVIVEDRGKKYALLVDELLGQSQVVIKNLESNYRKVDGVAGATILGDGSVAMILDVYGLVSLASRGRASSSGEHYFDSAEALDHGRTERMAANRVYEVETK